MKLVKTTHSPAETRRLAAELSDRLHGGEVLAFRGDLGAGKTCFVTGLCEGLGFTGEVSSPTFAIVNEYRGGRLDLFHFDMYRITGWDDLETTGYFDYLAEGGVLAVEWSENIAAALPGNTVFITVERIGDQDRIITVEGGLE